MRRAQWGAVEYSARSNIHVILYVQKCIHCKIGLELARGLAARQGRREQKYQGRGGDQEEERSAGQRAGAELVPEVEGDQAGQG